MEINFKTKAGNYKVSWESSGWSYAKAVVYKLEKVKFICFTYNRYVFVWEGSDTKLKRDAERMLPKRMHEWFKLSIYEYETYQKEWGNFCCNGETHEQIL